MKKLYVLFALLSYISFAQDLNMEDGTFMRCAPDKFFDSGGSGGSYSSNENLVTTICPQNADEFIMLDFTAFSTQLSVDVMTIYDGEDTSAPLIGTYSGVAGPGTVLASDTNLSGCITIQFVSDGSGTTTGWEADITCLQQCQTILASIDMTDPVPNVAGVIEVPPGTTVDFEGSATFSDDGTGATYNWNFGDGATDTGTSVSHFYGTSGTFNVTLTVTDTNPTGCSDIATITVLVLEPIVTINNAAYAESYYGPEELIENVLVSGGCSGVDNFSFQVSGTPNALTTKSYGYFTKGGASPDFPFEEGIVLSTGRAFPAGNTPNGGALVSFDNGQAGDPDLDAFFLPSDPNFDTNDATFIKFNFVPTADEISFRYIMFSEEYDGSTECSFADSFAFLLREVGTTTYQNLAVLPDGTPVSVTNINNSGTCTDNPEYFEGYLLNDTNYGGRTVVLTASANVTPNTTYEIKLVVADEGDSIWDSAIFLEAGSFNLGGELGDDITIAAGTAQCEGETVTLNTEAPTATHTWFFNGVEISGETSSTLDITEEGMYSVDVVFAPGCESSDSIEVEFKPSPIANPALDLSICSLTGVGEFDLTENDTEVLGAQDPNDFVITYHPTQEDADDNTNPLASPYTNTSNPQTIYVRIAENSQECYSTTTFELIFSQLEINPVTVFQVCDDDTDGFAMFDLNQKNDEVIGGLDPTTVNVSYYANQADADAGTNPLSIPFTNTVVDNQTIYIRLESNVESTCYNTTTLDLEVLANPIANTVTPLEVCDDDNDGFASFDLTLRDAQVVGPQTGMVVTYHETQSDANNGVNVLPIPYNNIVANVQTVYIRVESGSSGCYATEELTLLVNPLPNTVTVTDYELCDYNMPGDEVEAFDLTVKDSEIINGQAMVSVSYYENLIDAQALINPLTSPYNNLSNPQTIFYALVSNNTGCIATGNFDLIVNPLPVIIDPTPLEVCDDGVPDGLTAIDLTIKNGEVTGGDTTYSVSYHLTQFDADNALGPLPIPYTNTVNGQVVYVRAQDIVTGCYATTTLELIVEQAPVANTPVPLEYCDADSDGFGVFTLSDADNGITGGDPTLTVSYHETMADADNNVNALTSPYNNIVEGQQTVYVRVESATIATDCATVVELVLMVHPTPQIEDPTPLEVCDDVSADGFAQFDLTSKDAEILDGLDPLQYLVTYYEVEANAESGTGPILVPTGYTNTTAFNQTLWVRVEDTVNGCHKLTTLDLVVNALPVLIQPAPLELCDDNNPGDEVEAFTLEDANAEMLGGQTGISFTYYETQLDADNGTDPIVSPYMNTSNPQTVFVRATDDVTGCWVSTTATILLRVNPIPSPAAPTDLEVCDLDNDGFEEFDLESRTLEVINGELDIAITYHETQSDAEMGLNALASPYTNIVMDEQLIYIRAENTVTGCYNALETLTIRVLPSPVVPVEIGDYVVCDTDSDGFAQFDLTSKDAEILGGQDASEFMLTYHVSQADAESGSNPIANVTNYTNINNPQTIYVRLESGVNGCVTTTGLFEIRVELPPVAVQPTPLELCDDEVADEVTVFDLTVKDSEITGGEASWSVSYYETDADAQSGTGAVDATSYGNTSVNGAPANPQTLYVVVTDTDTGCVDYTTLTIRVLPNPTPSLDPADLELCDDINPGDMEEEFDLTENEVYIINGEAGVTVTYHETEEDAELGENAIADPTAYGNTSTPQTIHVRVTNDVTGCYTLVSFDIVVNPLPAVIPVTDFILCELDTDGFDGFDLALKDGEILNGQDASLFTVTYHATQLDADDLMNPLVSPYTNTSNPQQIFVAITNNVTGCSISTPSFNIEVQEAAEANSGMEPITYVICDDEMDDDNDLSNNSAQFDLTPVEDIADLDPLSVQAQVLDGQDPASYIVSYYETEEGAEQGVDPLPFLYENLTNPQVIYVRVDNDTMVDDGMGNMVDSSICYAVAELTLQVDPLPVFDLDDSYILCVGTNGTEVLGAPILDTGLDAAFYGFTWSLNGAEIPGATGSIYMPTEGGAYTVVVEDLATGCTSGDIAEVIESGPPMVTAVVTTEAFAETHVIEVIVDGDISQYEYSLDGGPWQDEPIFTGVSIGEHEVTARDRDGCGQASDKVTVMDYPAFFTPNGDGYNDTWNISLPESVGLSTKIYIFDRYGKLLKQISPLGEGWDGTYNGTAMPTSDYWFVVEYSEPATLQQKEFKAHFTLKR